MPDPNESLIIQDPELAEARVRRLMAKRADLINTWENREDRADLLRQVDAALDLYLIALDYVPEKGGPA